MPLVKDTMNVHLKPKYYMIKKKKTLNENFQKM